MGGNLVSGKDREKTAFRRNDAGLFIERRAWVYNDFKFHKQNTILVQSFVGNFRYVFQDY